MKKQDKSNSVLTADMVDMLDKVVAELSPKKPEPVVVEKVEEEKPTGLQIPIITEANEAEQSKMTESLRAKIKETVREQLTEDEVQQIQEASQEKFEDYIDYVNASVINLKHDDFNIMKLESEIESRILELDYAKLRLEHKLADLRVVKDNVGELEQIDEKLQTLKRTANFNVGMIVKMEDLKNKAVAEKTIKQL